MNMKHHLTTKPIKPFKYMSHWLNIVVFFFFLMPIIKQKAENLISCQTAAIQEKGCTPPDHRGFKKDSTVHE